MQFDLLGEARKCSKIFLDYDGTLVPITSRPEEAKPDGELLDLLDKLDKKYSLYIITGRSAQDIQMFLDSRYEIIAMHGAQIIHKGKASEFINGYEKYKEICDRYYERMKHLEKKYPGLMVINKGGGLQFHYFFMDIKFFKELLEEINNNVPEGMEIYSGKYVIEYRIKGVNKGLAIKKLIEGDEKVLFAGDDATDEEAFQLLKEHLTIKIGDGDTVAKYRMRNYAEFRDFLREMLK